MSNQPSSQSSQQSLGTLEFCAALNGDDPELVRVTLRKFIHLVRNERRQALESSSSMIIKQQDDDLRDSGDEESVNDEQDQQQQQLKPTKKPRIESWKLDSKAYNVPFVGTSIQKGSMGTVMKNEWPTGFVKAYLEVSPMARELIHSMEYFVPSHDDLFTWDTSDSLGKRKYVQVLKLLILYIQAFGELLTCAMPREKVLRMTYNSSPSSWRHWIESTVVGDDPPLLGVPTSSRHPFVQSIRDRLPYLLKLINKAVMTKSEHRNTKEGKGSYPTSQHILALSEEQVDVVITALIAITHLACTSIKAAQDVARGLNTIIHESVFMTLLRSHAMHRMNKKKIQSVSSETNDHNNNKETSAKARAKRSMSAHSACLDLASVLLETQDSLVFSLISKFGNKEGKPSMGLMYHVLRWGLSSDKFQDDRQTDDTYLIRLHRFLKSLREFLLRGDEGMIIGAPPDHRKTSSSSRNRSMVQLLKDDPLLRVCELALKTKSTAIHQDMNTLECVATEGRKLLFLLLIDVKSSPFLQIIHDTRSTDSTLYKSLAQQLIRCVHMLVSSTYDTYLRERIVEYLCNTPALLPYYFRSLSLPDPSPSLSFFAQITFVRTLLEKGPLYSEWLRETLEDSEEQSDCTLCIMPARVSKMYLTKSIQSPNALIISHILKLITSILRRTIILTRELRQEQRALLVVSIQKRMPDLQTLLAIRSRFDPFRAISQSPTTKTNSEKSDSNYFVMFYLCGVLQNYRSLFTASTQVTQYEWTKLLPDNHENFRTCPMWLQTRLIQTLISMYCIDESESIEYDAALSPKTLQILVQLRHHTTHPHIYHIIQSALIKLLFVLLRPADARSLTLEQNLCLRYECTLWAQIFTIDNIPFYCKQIESSQQGSAQHALSTFLSWRRTYPTEGIPSLCFSSLLSISWISVMSSFQKWKLIDVQALCNLTVKVLHFQVHPLLLASFIMQCLLPSTISEPKSADEAAILKAIITLRQYTGDRYNIQNQNRNTISENLVSSIDQDAKPTIQSKKIPFTDVSVSQDEIVRTRTIAIFSITDDTFLYLAYLKWLIQNINIKDFKDKPNIPMHFGSLRRVLVYVLLVNVNHSEFFISVLLSIIDDMLAMDSQANVTMMILFSSITSFTKETMCGDPYMRRCLSVLELYSKQRYIQSPSDTALFLSSLALSKFSPYHHILKTIGSILASIKFLAGDDFPFVYRVAIATIDNCLLKNDETDDEKFHLDFPLPFNLIVKSTFTEMVKIAIERENFDLLNLFLAYDVLSCAQVVIQRLVSNIHGELLTRALLAAKIVCELEKQEIGWTEVLDLDDLRSAAGLINEAICRLLAGRDISSIDGKFSEGYLCAMSVTMRFGLICEEALRPFYNLAVSIFETAAKRSKKILLEIEKQLIKFLCKKSSYDGNQRVNVIVESPHFYGSALDRFFQTLPHVLRESSPECDTEKMQLNQLHQLRTLIVEFCSIVAHNTNYHFGNMKGWIISCLKYGINDEASSVSSCCLQLLRLTMRWSVTPRFTPSQVFLMATSHSRFDKLLSTTQNETKEQLIRLLIVCVTLDSSIKAERTVFISLLSSYNAGLQHNDKLTRLLLFLLCQNYRLDQTPVSMSDFAWGNFQLRKGTFDDNILVAADHAFEWEWLLEGLDNRRILRTIHDFPNKEDLNPSIDVNMEETIRDDDFPLYACRRYIDEDDRYDPSFLVPLILGVLRAFFPKVLESNDQREKFVLIAQRLCRKGAMSLALASFSASCQGLRQTSLGVLGLLLHAMQMREAHSLVSWKERPQLEMILNSFQRGVLWLQIIGSGSVVNDKPHSSESHMSDFIVPLLPNICSIFLAKAAWILSSPADDLYPAINKYFLRLDSEHGAYKDFYSLPAFIPLFCNSSEDITQAEKERIWAVQLLKEGIVDQVSLDVIIQKHVPELLMTAFDTLLTRSNVYTEVESILETLRTIFHRGLSDTFPSLTNKLGLFPWILQMGHKLASMRHKMLWGFLDFARKSLLTYAQFVHPNSSENLLDCFVNIANVAILSAIDDNVECRKNEAPARHEHIQEIASDILISAHSNIAKQMIGKRVDKITSGDSYLSFGLCASSCVKFLDFCDSLQTRRQYQLVHSICFLPIDIHGSNDTVAFDFIRRVLSFLSKVSSEPVKLSKALPLDIINRVRLLVEFFPDSHKSCDKDVISRLLQVRQICKWKKKSWEDWLVSISLLLNCANNEEDIWAVFSSRKFGSI